MKTTDLDYKVIADEFGVTPNDVRNIYYDTFEFIAKHMASFNIHELGPNHMIENKTSFSIPGMGKLYMDDKLIKLYKEIWKKY